MRALVVGLGSIGRRHSRNLKAIDPSMRICGGGVQDALFRGHGAHVSAVDISRQRALSAAHKLSMVTEGSGFAAQADGERLPFKDASFDIVYSNGVMHHAEPTETVIDEAYRVLKPGGQIVVMLYAKLAEYTGEPTHY